MNKSIKEQYDILRQYFPHHFLNKNTDELVMPPLPEHAEGWYLIPEMKGEYTEELQHVLDSIGKSRAFENYNDVKKIRTRSRIQEANVFPKYGDFYLYPAQLGSRWKGKSVKEAREKQASNEILLNSYEVGCILLTHPEILKSYNDLRIDCASDGYELAVGVFSLAPVFGFGVDRVGFVAYWFGNARDHCGSASCFIPQSNFEPRKLGTVEDLNSAIKIVKSAGYKVTKEM